MLELLDSSPVLTDRSALIDRLAADGYLFFRGLVDADTVGSVRADILRAIAPLGWTAPGTDPLDAKPGPDARSEGQEGWFDGYRAIQQVESFHRLAHDERIVSALGVLFGEDVVVLPEKIARVIQPQLPGGTTPPHQDFPNIGGTVDVFTVWVPLADAPKEHGGLAILRGSHRDGLRQVTIDSSQRGAASIYIGGVTRDDPEWSSTDFRAGDVLVFHSLTVHAAIPNTSDCIRVSSDFRYQPVSEPVAHISLQPHFFQRGLDDIPPWSEFDAGWSSTAWHEVPAAAHVVEGMLPVLANRIGPHAGARHGKSQFFDTSAFARQAAEQSPFVTAK